MASARRLITTRGGLSTVLTPADPSFDRVKTSESTRAEEFIRGTMAPDVIETWQDLGGRLTADERAVLLRGWWSVDYAERVLDAESFGSEHTTTMRAKAAIAGLLLHGLIEAVPEVDAVFTGAEHTFDRTARASMLCVVMDWQTGSRPGR